MEFRLSLLTLKFLQFQGLKKYNIDRNYFGVLDRLKVPLINEPCSLLIKSNINYQNMVIKKRTIYLRNRTLEQREFTPQVRGPITMRL